MLYCGITAGIITTARIQNSKVYLMRWLLKERYIILTHKTKITWRK